MIKTWEVQFELVTGMTVYVIVAEADAESAKRVAVRQIEDIRKAGYYADETVALEVKPIERVA